MSPGAFSSVHSPTTTHFHKSSKQRHSTPLCPNDSCSATASFFIPGKESNVACVQRKDPSPLYARRFKDIVLADECRNYLLDGILQVADTVKVTLGPRGRNILLERDYGSPMIVNDGVTIARNIELKDRRHNAGAKLVQEVASTSDDRAGDGTTSTAILTAEIAKKGVEYVNQGHNPIPLQKGILKASKMIMDEIRLLAKPVVGHKDLVNIATVATSGNTEMGNVIASAFDKLGPNAATVLEDNPALEDALEFTEGYTFERGWASPYFLVNEERDVLEWQNPQILVCDYRIDSAQSILKILEHFVRTKEPFVIIAEDFGPEAMQTLIINKMRQLLKVVAIKAPSFGERRKDYLRDIAISTNAKLISKDVGMPLEDASPADLGTSRSIVVRKERSSIVTNPEFKTSIDQRINQLKSEMEKSTSKFDREKLTERIAALSGGIARILIGASTETEQKEKRLRYEDAINAVRAAMETGYVPGGGVTYLAASSTATNARILKNIEESAMAQISETGSSIADSHIIEMESEIELQKAGATIVIESLKSITRQIADNAGVNGDKVVETILNSGKDFGFGWNAKTSLFGDMISQGVIDPAKVVISAVEHSCSTAGLVLTTEGMMVENEDERTTTSSNDSVSTM